jgi:hypothetical protein
VVGRWRYRYIWLTDITIVVATTPGLTEDVIVRGEAEGGCGRSYLRAPLVTPTSWWPVYRTQLLGAAMVHVFLAVLDDASNMTCHLGFLRTPKDFPVPETAVTDGGDTCRVGVTQQRDGSLLDPVPWLCLTACPGPGSARR